MSLEQYALLGEIIGTIAVVGSLAYVAIQLKQNTEAIHAQSRQAVYEGAQNELFKMVDTPDIVLNIIKKEHLTAREQSQLNSFWFSSFRAREYAWLQYQNKIMDELQWKTEIAVIQYICDSSRVRLWWKKSGHMGFDKGFVSFIEELLKSTPARNVTYQSGATWADEDNFNKSDS
jgi:hypothetical protein